MKYPEPALGLDKSILTVYILNMSIAEAKLFKNGRSQAVRLPKDFRMSGKSCYVKRFGAGVLLVPKDRAWSMLEESLNEFTEDFMNKRDQGEYEKREPFR